MIDQMIIKNFERSLASLGMATVDYFCWGKYEEVEHGTYSSTQRLGSFNIKQICFSAIIYLRIIYI